MSGEKFVSDLRERKHEAVERLVQSYTEPLLAGALGLGFDRLEAEELVQDTLVAFLSAVHRFEMRSQLKTYLFGILYHKASEVWRRHKKEEAAEDIEDVFSKRFDARGMWLSPPRGPEDEVLSGEALELISQCSEGLPLQQRTAFYLKEVEGEDTQSLCKILEVSATHLGVLLFRARNKLRECLEKKWGNSR